MELLRTRESDSAVCDRTVSKRCFMPRERVCYFFAPVFFCLPNFSNLGTSLQHGGQRMGQQ